jgi:hypothetical protein
LSWSGGASLGGGERSGGHGNGIGWAFAGTVAAMSRTAVVNAQLRSHLVMPAPFPSKCCSSDNGLVKDALDALSLFPTTATMNFECKRISIVSSAAR